MMPGGMAHPFGMPGMGHPHEGDEEMAELMQSDMELEHQTMHLAHRLRGAKTDQAETLKTELSEVISKHFDVRQQKRELQIKRMEESLEKLRETVKKRAEAREEIVKKRLGELVGEQGELDF
jgi:septum formation topological specificity factor MinE